MIRHVALFRWKEGTSAEAVEALASGLATMPDVIPGIQRYEFGSDLGITDGAYDFGLVADFDAEAAYHVYATHPAHLELVDLLRRFVEETSRMQFHLA